jgi:hypothetical protein
VDEQERRRELDRLLALLANTAELEKATLLKQMVVLFGSASQLREELSRRAAETAYSKERGEFELERLQKELRLLDAQEREAREFYRSQGQLDYEGGPAGEKG